MTGEWLGELTLEGVALRQHAHPYPFEYDPYDHQLRLSELVGDDAGFVAVDDSPTGGGKTSAWLAPALDEQLDTIAIYPTNALVVDQADQVQRAAEATDHDIAVLTITSEHVARHRAEMARNVRSNAEVIDHLYRSERRANDQVLLLTNPDSFVMMARGLYGRESRVYRQIPFAVVDEFHQAGRKEQNTLRYLLDELWEWPDEEVALNRIAFLSATPDDRQEGLFADAMAAPYHRVTAGVTDERRPFLTDPGDEWHPVMPPIKLDVRTAPTFGTADVLLDDDRADLLSFCAGDRTARDGHDKVAIVLDGVHEVQRVHEYLADELDCRVERIDGFRGEEKARKLYEFDVLVSNAAVEVGVDFEIDRLLFAGHQKSSFLQRLGRLRSRPDVCRARCYVPRSVGACILNHDAVEGGPVTRRELDDVLATAFPEPRRPESFDWRYSGPEAGHHLEDRVESSRPGRREEVFHRGRRRIDRHFLDPFDGLTDDDLERAADTVDWQTLEQLQWYRGDSIQALVYDRTAGEEGTVRAYDIMYLLRYGRVSFHGRETFERIIPEAERATVDRLARYVDGFCTFDGTVETTAEGYGRSVSFTGPRLGKHLRGGERTPTVFGGLKIRVDSEAGMPGVNGVDRFNERLSTRSNRLGPAAGILGHAVPKRPTVVQQQYGLDDFFFLYPVVVQEGSACLALGTDALYLHCHEREADKERISDGDDLIGGVGDGGDWL